MDERPQDERPQLERDCYAYLSTLSSVLWADWDISRQEGRDKAAKWLAAQITEVNKITRDRQKVSKARRHKEEVRSRMTRIRELQADGNSEP
jgi:hypothetical protein